MKVNPITFILWTVFIYPIAKGFLLKFSSHNLKSDIQGMESNIAFIMSLFLGIYFSKKIFVEHSGGIYGQIYDAIPPTIEQYIDSNIFIYYVVLIPITIFIFYKIITFILELINHITFYPIVNVIEKLLQNKSSIFKRIGGALFQFPKAICYVLLVTFLLNGLSMFNILGEYNKYLENSDVYSSLCKQVVVPVVNSNIAKNLPNILDNSFKVVVKKAGSEDDRSDFSSNSKGRTIVYYNGVTLDEAVKSNESINTFARQLISGEATSKGKAKALYNWIGSYISYDYDKANRVLNNDFEIKSGAIPAFQTRQGICFDYASLYVAMARAVGLKVRIVTGEGFNGVTWVSHAWNQVYSTEEKRWINVDTTFYKGGNYFDSRRFEIDHRNSKTAGEW